MNYEKLTDAELNEAIAEAKGWVSSTGRLDWASSHDAPYWEKLHGIRTAILPDWSTDISDAYKLEDEIIDDSQRDSYSEILFAIIDPYPQPNIWRIWPIIHATPRQRATAWLKWKEVTK